MQFVDANIFLRYLTRDDEEKAQACRRLFEQARHNEVELTTTESAIAEVVYVLSSKRLYNTPRAIIRQGLYPILSLPGLKLPNRQVYLRALDLYAGHNLDFEDTLLIAHMERQGADELVSYDRGFDSITNVKRQEP